MKCNNAGFTFWEIIIVIAIIAILSVVAVPSMVGWREQTQLRGSFENIKGDLQWAKVRAIRNHEVIAVVFDSGGYTIQNAAGDTMRSRQLSAGVEINLTASTIPEDPDNLNQLKTLFDTRGRCTVNTNNEDTDGLIVLEDSSGRQRQLSINPLGQIRQE